MVSLVSTVTFLLSLIFLPTFISSGNALNKEKCMNNGTLAVADLKTVCICPPPFTGRVCEDFACVNGLATGDQYNHDNPFFNKRCLCDAGWTGELCDQSIINRCGTNGKEIKSKCHCKSNFVGNRCEFVTKCTHGQLYNGRCSCHYGWAGDFCDKIICHQGEPDLNSEQCICPSKYRGKYCDFCAEPASSPPPECATISDRQPIQINGGNFLIVAAIVILSVLIFLGISTCYLRYKMRMTKGKLKNRKKSMTDVESTSNENAKDTYLLYGGHQMIGKDHALGLEKFHGAPPPYETVAA